MIHAVFKFVVGPKQGLNHCKEWVQAIVVQTRQLPGHASLLIFSESLGKTLHDGIPDSFGFGFGQINRDGVAADGDGIGGDVVRPHHALSGGQVKLPVVPVAGEQALLGIRGSLAQGISFMGAAVVQGKDFFLHSN